MTMMRAVLFSVAMILAVGLSRGQNSPTCGNVFIDAQFVLSGAGWLNVQGNATAWAALPGALVSDLASLLGRAPNQIDIETVTAGNSSLTVVFTARSDALAEAARIAALIRDVVSATSPLPATLNVYSSVGGQSSSDVTVASHTATSRDAFDSTCAGSSNNNEITTGAPYTSNNNEVTTAAPYTSNNNEITTAAPYTSNNNEITTAAPYTSNNNQVTTAAPYTSNHVTTAAPYTSNNNQVTTAAPCTSNNNEVTTAAPYTSNHVTTPVPYTSSNNRMVTVTPPPVMYANVDSPAKAEALTFVASAAMPPSMWVVSAVVGLATAMLVV